MRFALYPPNFGEFGDVATLVDLARRAEAAGWDGFFLWDHLVAPAPVVDPWVALTAVAGATERLMLGPLIVPLARRRPQVVALAAATLQRVSGGRFVLGAGLGVVRDFERFGEDSGWRVRAELLEENLAAVRSHWRDGLFGDAPEIPVWVGGVWPRTKPFHGVEHADGVFPLRLVEGGGIGTFEPEELPAIRAALPERAQRDLVVWSTSIPADERAYDDAGATWWAVAPTHDAPLAPYARLVESGPR